MKHVMAFGSGATSRARHSNRSWRKAVAVLPLLTFAGLLLIWQAALTLLLLDGFIGLNAYVGLHVSCSLAVAAWLIPRARSGTGARFRVALQMLAWAAIAGPFGALIAVALLLPQASARSRRLRDGEGDRPNADRFTMSQIERLHTALLDRRLRLEGARDVRPLVDVISEGSRLEKLAALGVIYRRYEARFSALLKLGLQDGEASVRVLAATVMAKLHATHSRTIGEHQSAIAVEPSVAQNWKRLATARLAYADSGLLEAQRSRAQIESAIDDLSHAVELDPSDQASIHLSETRRQQLEFHETRSLSPPN